MDRLRSGISCRCMDCADCNGQRDDALLARRCRVALEPLIEGDCVSWKTGVEGGAASASAICSLSNRAMKKAHQYSFECSTALPRLKMMCVCKQVQGEMDACQARLACNQLVVQQVPSRWPAPHRIGPSCVTHYRASQRRLAITRAGRGDARPASLQPSAQPHTHQALCAPHSPPSLHPR